MKKILLVAFTLIFSQLSVAFTVNTHVWISQEVINDISDGFISIKLGDKAYSLPVDPSIVNAIAQYPEYYRMGNIGPDAMPDILTGQMVVHPGNPNGWETDDWLRWLLENAKTPEQIAYTYGYLGHAAADVFAHTYVNQYSGDIFSITDGELDVEKRHILLEKYIDQYLPTIKDKSGNSLGAAHNLVATPHEFILDTLIFNNTVADEYSSAGSYHLTLIHTLQREIQSLLDGAVTDLEREMISAAISVSVHKEVNDAIVEGVLLAQSEIKDAIISNQDNIQELANGLFDIVGDGVEGMGEIQQAVSSNIIDYGLVNTRVIDMGLELTEALLKLPTISKHVDFLEVVGRRCSKACIVCSKVCKEIKDWVTKINPLWRDQKSAIDKLQKAIDDLEREKSKLKNNLNGLIDEATRLKLDQLERSNERLDLIVDLAQRYGGSANPYRAHLEGWRSDIFDAMYAYSETSEQIIKNSTIPNASLLDPMLSWVDCWGLALTSLLPAPVNNLYCKQKSEYEAVIVELNQLQDQLEEVAADVSPVLRELSKLKNKLEAEFKQMAEDIAYEVAETIVGVEFRDIIDILKEQPSSADLNAQFGKDNSGKSLLKIPDISTRVQREMYLVNGKLNPEEYGVIYNAILLVKLSLLGPEQLNQLARYAGIERSALYGSKLYDESAGADPVNILVGAIRSIDGNHQWMEFAPPYIRTQGKKDTGWPHLRKYGYGSAGGKGFRLWQDERARSGLFRKLFKGPLVPGLQLANNKNIPDDYPYKPCDAYPFPLVDDNTCTAILLIPIMHLLLH